MALNNEEKGKLICEMNSYDYIRFVWCDIHGISRCKSVPRRNTAAILDDGLGIPIGKKYKLYMKVYSYYYKKALRWPIY